MAKELIAKTYAFIRDSAEQQDLEGQHREIECYCATHGIRIDKWLLVEISNRKTLRKRRFEQLMPLLKEGDTLIVAELSRLGRSIGEVCKIVTDLAEKEITFIAIKQGIQISHWQEDTRAKMTTTMFAVFGDLAHELISERANTELARVKEKGWSAKAIEGRRKGNANSATVRARKAEEYAQKMAQYIRDYRRQHYTFAEICESLERSGILTPSGKQRWHPQTVKSLVDRLA
ncbi:MAG: recombinase family protein [Syntrophobacteraceae bacterium]